MSATARSSAGERTAGRLLPHQGGLGSEYAIARGLAYAPYADLLWWETSEPDLDEAERVRQRDPQAVPGQDAGLQLLAELQLEARSWPATRSPSSSARSAAMGYKFQFVTLAGFHSLNYSMFKLARGYKDRGMAAYSELQQAEFAAEAKATPRRATSAKWASATSTRWRPSRAAASRPPRRSPARPRRRSSTTASIRRRSTTRCTTTSTARPKATPGRAARRPWTEPTPAAAGAGATRPGPGCCRLARLAAVKQRYGHTT